MSAIVGVYRSPLSPPFTMTRFRTFSSRPLAPPTTRSTRRKPADPRLALAGVGKSSLVLRFITNEFKPYQESTIGASFMSKLIMVEGAPIKFQIWDTAGQEKYHSLAPMYYKGAAAAIVVYDITKRNTFKVSEGAPEPLVSQAPPSTPRRRRRRRR